MGQDAEVVKNWYKNVPEAQVLQKERKKAPKMPPKKWKPQKKAPKMPPKKQKLQKKLSNKVKKGK